MRARVKDFLTYVLIGVFIVAALMVYASYVVKTKEQPSSAEKWIWFSIASVFVFGNALRYSNPLWRLSRYWWTLLPFLVCHFVVGILILLRLSIIPPIDFVVVGVAEYFALDAYLRLILDKK